MGEILDLRWALSVVWRRRLLITVVICAFLLAGVALNAVIPPVYESRAMVLVANPPFQVGSPTEPGGTGPKFGVQLTPTLSTEAFIGFATSPALIQRLATETEGRPTQRLRNVALVARRIRDTNLVELRVRGRGAARVAKIASAWIRLLAAEGNSLLSSTIHESTAVLERRLTDARRRLSEAEERSSRFQAVSRVGLLEARIRQATEQIAQFRRRLSDVAVEVATFREELAQVTAEARRQPQVRTLAKSLFDDRFLEKAVDERRQLTLRELSGLKVATEEIDPLYDQLRAQRADLVVRIRALEAERAQLRVEVGRLEAEVRRLRAALAADRLVEQRLARDLENARQVFDVVLKRHEEALIASGTLLGVIRTVVRPVVPDEPIAPRRTLNLAVAAIFGLLAGGLTAVVIEQYGFARVPLGQRRGEVELSDRPVDSLGRRT